MCSIKSAPLFSSYMGFLGSGCPRTPGWCSPPTIWTEKTELWFGQADFHLPRKNRRRDPHCHPPVQDRFRTRANERGTLDAAICLRRKKKYFIGIFSLHNLWWLDPQPQKRVRLVFFLSLHVPPPAVRSNLPHEVRRLVGGHTGRVETSGCQAPRAAARLSLAEVWTSPPRTARSGLSQRLRTRKGFTGTFTQVVFL